MKARRSTIASLLVLYSLALQPATPSQQKKPAKSQVPAPIFNFHDDEFWLNLHHFLYVLGRAENKARDASRQAVVSAPAEQEQGLVKLSADQQSSWRQAVSSYAKELSKKDLIFDGPLAKLTNQLAGTGNAKSLKSAEIDAATVAILESAAPIYRKTWWPKHQRANKEWRVAVQQLVNQHGAAVLSFITNAYRMSWPTAGYAVHISGYTNWAGAYSTDNNLLVVSSLDVGNRGTSALETIFHEGMHQWDPQIDEALKSQAQLQNKPVPRSLSHALIFFTAGEAVHRQFKDYVPYAVTGGVWARGWTRLQSTLDQVWKPYLDGNGTRDEAFAELIKRLTAPAG
jgi:hypothetical protein